MILGEKLLDFFSDHKYDVGPKEERDFLAGSNLFKSLAIKFNGYFDVTGKVVLDLGCGLGYTTVSIAKNGAKKVVGIDLDCKRIEKARLLSQQEKVEHIVKFVCQDVSKYASDSFDIAISKHSFEHYKDPENILAEYYRLLKKGGKLFIYFGPLWYSPYGAHMFFFTRIPWVHLIFSEKTIFNVRKKFRPNENATRYEEIKGGLNKMTVKKFKRLIGNTNFKLNYYVPNHRFNKRLFKILNQILTNIPILKELFTINIACILEKK